MKTILVDAVRTFVSEEGAINEELQNLLESYDNPKIILTNAPRAKFPVYNLDQMPYEVFTLEKNPEKPNPKYFTTMLERFGLSKDDVLYFEHNQDAVASARSVGINTHHYDHEKQDVAGIKTFLYANL